METIKKTITKTELSQTVSARMNDILRKRNISQAQLVKKMQDAGYSILQSDASKILSDKAKVNMYFLVAFSEVMGVSLDELACGRHNAAPIRLDGKNFQVDPAQDDGFENIIGDYFIYFESTDHQERGKLVSGKLSLQRREGFCEAVMILERVGKKRNLKKTYHGQMFLSRKMRSAWVLLFNENFGEFSMFQFRYRDFLTRPMECRLAMAVTVSSGESKRPTAHRLVLTRRELEERELKVIASNLKIDNKEIIIEENMFKRYMENTLEQQEFMRELWNVVEDKRYVLIENDDIRKAKRKMGNQELLQIRRALSELSEGRFSNAQIDEEDDFDVFTFLNQFAEVE